MANQLSPFSPNLQNRYTNTQRSRHTKFDAGMIRDVASWELPEGACYDAVDMICDFAGKIRKRGGTTSPSTIDLPAYSENLVAFKSSGYDQLALLMGSASNNPGNVYLFNTATGVATTLSSTLSGFGFNQSGAVGRPFQHGNYVAFPFQPTGLSANAPQGIILSGGSKGGHVVSAAATVTAGDNRITAIGAPSVGGVLATHVGAFVTATNATNQYRGRVVAYISATSVRVEPTPTLGFAANGFELLDLHPMYSTSSGGISGAFGVSFQNRMVLGATLEGLPTTVANGTDFKRNRLVWSQLSTEKANNPTAGGGPGIYDGDPLLLDGQPFLGSDPTYYNYQDIPNLGNMTGLAALGDGQLVIFGTLKTFRLTGQLATETIANNSLNYSVDQISANIGCISARSIQPARGGLVWCGADNLYEYDGAKLSPLLNGRNQRYLQGLLNGGASVYGSAYAAARNHYYLSLTGSQGGLMLNLDNLAMTRITNVQIFDGATDPNDSSKLWAARWWDITNTVPTMTKGQLIALNPIWFPTSANKNDADGTAVLSVVQTAAYVNGALAANKMTVDVNVTADLRGASSPTATVKADTKLNVADASFTTLGTIAAGTAAASKSFPVGYQVAEGPAVEIQIGNDAACDSFELLGLDFGTQGRPEEFST